MAKKNIIGVKKRNKTPNKVDNEYSQDKKKIKAVNNSPIELIKKNIKRKQKYYKYLQKKSFQNNINSIKKEGIEIKKIKVVSILDVIPYEWLKYEVNLIPLKMSCWKNTILNVKPDLLLVQSTWHDHRREWKNKIPYLKPKTNNILKKVVDFCKTQHIPTVFWNIEDPYHFYDFIEAAKLFDYIFTTDSNTVPKYKKIVKHNNVYTLPFAAQPKIHNPIGKGKIRLGNVAFAGSWYSKGHNDRKKDIEIVLKPALKYDLHIYDRMYYLTNNIKYKFPDIYQPCIKGHLPYNKVCDAYKSYDILLNVNTVQNSPTMFSCRIFELLACGANIISGYSIGIEKMFPNIVKLCRTQEDTEYYLRTLLCDKEQRDRLSLLGQRIVFKYHTYEHRIKTILEKVGIKYMSEQEPGVTIITSCTTDTYIDNIFENYSRQSYKQKELLIITANDNPNLEELKKKSSLYSNVRIFIFNCNNPLSNCLNFVIGKSRFNYIAIFNEIDYYAPEFIGDLINAFKYTDADIVGKLSHYVYFEESKTLAIRFPDKEYRYVDFLSASTMIIKKNVFNKIKFNENTIDVYTQFINDCIKNNIKLYSADRYNYINFIKPNTKGNSCLLSKEVIKDKCTIINNFDNYKNFVTV
ncbi:glycosyltransferase [Caloranaerobacter sp. TR13]|uniref:glycosyltransferase family protein n=1 Tax=Caloranaerobacter sp. TR13 TaxID=1302151 RepID=UPI0006D486B3|nr:glycosyltransferase [Caloranaerobacter sp. TR13]